MCVCARYIGSPVEIDIETEGQRESQTNGQRLQQVRCGRGDGGGERARERARERVRDAQTFSIWPATPQDRI